MAAGCCKFCVECDYLYAIVRGALSGLLGCGCMRTACVFCGHQRTGVEEAEDVG